MNNDTLVPFKEGHSALAAVDRVQKASDALSAHNFTTTVVASGSDAVEFIKRTVPPGATVMNGTSTTLEQIGFIDYLKSGAHGWKNNHEVILAETDPQKQGELRKHAVVSDYYFGSVHAVTENGELVIASNTGSQLPHHAFTSQHLILVVSTKKIVPTLSDAFERIAKHVVPLEDERSKKAYGVPTQLNKTLILHGENAFMGRTVHVVFVQEDLGF